MTCRVCEPGGVPPAICRRCHPELNMTREHRAELDASDRAQREAERGEQARVRDLAKAQRRLASITRKGEPEEGSVDAKVAASMRRKIARLGGKEAA